MSEWTASSAAGLRDRMPEADVDARLPESSKSRRILLYTALAWSLFQLWIASPLQYSLGFLIVGDTQARAIHLAFALFLTFLSYPFSRKTTRDYIVWREWMLAGLAAFCAAYLFLFYDAVASRPGLPTWYDITVACIGMLLLLEATRRALGWPLTVVVALFLLHTFAGSWGILPDILAHRGQSLAKVASHQWLTSEGVYGVPLGASTSFVFLFVLLGALLEKAGAGNYFYALAYALVGRARGRAGKAAVLASGVTSIVSGSAASHATTAGSITIPNMRKGTFSAEQAGGIAAAASVNGQLLPPVMGAVAFLMAEYVGHSYIDVMRHALFPAILAYIALLAMVHLEAVKDGMKPVAHPDNSLWKQLLGWGIALASLAIVAGVTYYVVSFIKQFADGIKGWGLSLVLCAVYAGLIWWRSRISQQVRNAYSPERLLDVLGAGLHLLLPIILLVWCLVMERMAPGLAVFWAVVLTMVMLVTQRPLMALFEGRRKEVHGEWREGMGDVLAGLIAGARGMIGIGVATAAAGVIVGTVSLTGITQALTDIIGMLSANSFLFALVLSGAMCLLLGAGLPTAANYVVVASVLAPVIVELGLQSGLILPLLAVHMFLFYFGMVGNIMPPMGRASAVAAELAGGHKRRTGALAVRYGFCLLVLPFLFIYSNEVLLLNLESFWIGVLVLGVVILAMLLIACALQGYFYTWNLRHESVLLFICALSLLYPRLWMDVIAPPFEEAAAEKIEQAAEQVPPGDKLKLRVRGEDSFGDTTEFYALLPLEAKGSGEERLVQAGLFLRHEDKRVYVDDLGFNSAAEDAGLDFQQEIIGVEVQRPQPSKRWVYIPVLLAVCGILFMQRRRKVVI